MGLHTVITVAKVLTGTTRYRLPHTRTCWHLPTTVLTQPRCTCREPATPAAQLRLATTFTCRQEDQAVLVNIPHIVQRM